jgi:hypothetical protein
MLWPELDVQVSDYSSELVSLSKSTAPECRLLMLATLQLTTATGCSLTVSPSTFVDYNSPEMLHRKERQHLLIGVYLACILGKNHLPMLPTAMA